MKVKEKQEARKLRKEEGLSLKEISEKLNVAKSSVSLWVRDIELTLEQQEILNGKNPNFTQYCHSSETLIKNARLLRKQYQQEGRHLFHELKGEKRDIFIAGCMLYWAEGTKSKNSIRLSNSDKNMIKFFVKFLEFIFNLQKEKILFSINCYTDIHNIDEIEKHWLEVTSLSYLNMRKSTLNYPSKYSRQKKRGKSPYGVCKITVHSSQIVQQIYGALQEMAGFEEDGNWLK